MSYAYHVLTARFVDSMHCYELCLCLNDTNRVIGATGEPAQDVMAHEPAEAGGAGVTEGVQLKQAAVAGGYVLLVLADGALKLLAQEPEEEGEPHFCYWRVTLLLMLLFLLLLLLLC
jgi:hypothetical protein